MKEQHLGIKNFHLNRKGNDAFAETLSNLAEWNPDFSPLEGSYYKIKNFPNTSNTIVSNAKSTLGEFYISNINRRIFEHLNFSFLKSKIDFPFKKMEASIDTFLISEWNLEESFPQCQFVIEGSNHLIDLVTIKVEEEYCCISRKIFQPMFWVMISFQLKASLSK